MIEIVESGTVFSLLSIRNDLEARLELAESALRAAENERYAAIAAREAAEAEVERLRSSLADSANETRRVPAKTIDLCHEVVKREYESAIEKHGEFHSLHEGYAVLLEEVDELWDEIKRKPHLRSRENLINEAAQVAAMATKILKMVTLGGVQ